MASTYRPTSLNSVVVKPIEKTTLMAILNCAEEHDFLSNEYGFTRDLSCSKNLLFARKDWDTAKDKVNTG